MTTLSSRLSWGLQSAWLYCSPCSGRGEFCHPTSYRNPTRQSAYPGWGNTTCRARSMSWVNCNSSLNASTRFTSVRFGTLLSGKRWRSQQVSRSYGMEILMLFELRPANGQVRAGWPDGRACWGSVWISQAQSRYHHHSCRGPELPERGLAPVPAYLWRSIHGDTDHTAAGAAAYRA